MITPSGLQQWIEARMLRCRWTSRRMLIAEPFLFVFRNWCQMFFLLQKCWLFWDSWLCLFDKPKNCLKRKICSPQILPPNYSTGRWFCCKTWQSLSIIVIIIIIIIHPRRENAEYKISHPHQPEYLTNNLYDLVLRNSPGCSKLLALRSCNDLNKVYNLHTAQGTHGLLH